MGKFYQIHIALVCQLIFTVALAGVIQPKQFHSQPRDVSSSKVALPQNALTIPQNVFMSLSIEPCTGPSAIPCLASIRVSNLLPLEAVTPTNNAVPAPFTEGLNPATGGVSSLLISFSDNNPNVSEPYKLSPKEPRKSVIRPSFPFIKNNPTIKKSLNVPQFTAGHIDQDDLIPTVQMQRNLLPPIKNPVNNFDSSSKLINSESLPNKINYSILNQGSSLNKQNLQQPKLIDLNNYIDSTAIPKEPVRKTLSNISFATAIDKDQYAIKSSKDVIPTSLLTPQEPLSISTNYNIIKYPLKTRNNFISLSTANKFSPSVNNGLASSLLPNLTLSPPSQSNKLPPSEEIHPVVSQSPSFSRPQTLGISPIAQSITSNSKSSEKLIEILKSSCYKNYKSSEATSLNDNVVPLSLKPQNLINATDKTSPTTFNLVDSLLRSPVTKQDQSNMFKSTSLLSEVPILGSKSLISTAIEKNYLSTELTKRLIKQSNATVNPCDSKPSPDSLGFYTLGTTPSLNNNEINYNDIPGHLEMSKNLGAKNLIQQNKSNKDKTLSKSPSYDSKGVSNVVQKYSDPEYSISSDLARMTLPNKDALSNERFNPISDNHPNLAVFQTFNSTKQLEERNLISNLEPIRKHKSSEFPVEHPISSTTVKMAPNPPGTSVAPFNVTSPLVKSPSFLPKPKMTNLSTELSLTSASSLLPTESLSPFADVSKSISFPTPCITSIVINIIPYTQETTSEIIIII